MHPRNSVIVALLLTLVLGVASPANAQDPEVKTEEVADAPAPIASLTLPQLREQIELAQREIANAQEQARQFPDHRDACLDNRDQWRVELIALQGELIRRLTAENEELRRPPTPPAGTPPAATPPTGPTPPAAPPLNRPPVRTGEQQKAPKPADQSKPVDKGKKVEKKATPEKKGK